MTAELQSWVQIKIHRKGFHKMWIQRLTSYQFRILFYLRGSKELTGSTGKTLPKKFYKGLCSGLHVATMFWSALGPSLRYPFPRPLQCCAPKKDSFPSISFTSQHCLEWESLKFYWYHWRVPNTSDLQCSLSSTLKSNIFMLSMKWS